LAFRRFGAAHLPLGKTSLAARPPLVYEFLTKSFRLAGAAMMAGVLSYEIDWVRALEYVSGGIAATGILWQTSIWLSILFIH
jgi:hypothetical protein